MTRPYFARPFIKYDGTPSGCLTTVLLYVCHCEDRRGPEGGVCGNCAEAIPSNEEQARLDKGFNR